MGPIAPQFHEFLKSLPCLVGMDILQSIRSIRFTFNELYGAPIRTLRGLEIDTLAVALGWNF